MVPNLRSRGLFSKGRKGPRYQNGLKQYSFNFSIDFEIFSIFLFSFAASSLSKLAVLCRRGSSVSQSFISFDPPPSESRSRDWYRYVTKPWCRSRTAYGVALFCAFQSEFWRWRLWLIYLLCMRVRENWIFSSWPPWPAPVWCPAGFPTFLNSKILKKRNLNYMTWLCFLLMLNLHSFWCNNSYE